MITKDSIYEQIAKAKEAGATKSDLGWRKKDAKELVERFLAELEQESKIFQKGNRYYIYGTSVQAKKTTRTGAPSDIKEILKDYVKRDELEVILQDAYEKIAKLKEEIDRLYDYSNDVFIEVKKNISGKSSAVTREELRIIYDNLNSFGHFGDSIPLPLFKDEVMKKFTIDEGKLNEMLLALDDEGVIYLQTAD
ncbi:MAG: hypothetical protein ACP5GW_06535, partial [Caldisericaceae bacterium]